MIPKQAKETHNRNNALERSVINYLGGGGGGGGGLNMLYDANHIALGFLYIKAEVLCLITKGNATMRSGNLALLEKQVFKSVPRRLERGWSGAVVRASDFRPRGPWFEPRSVRISLWS